MMEFLVILHTVAGDVRTVYPSNQQQEAIDLWVSYIKAGKRATLTVEK